ncbi:MAG: DUF4430 domain-containing protein [Patescibacteria group bacterium]|nr:DUF4430 domain-containing protein [Patescibacteria group bacterium]
MKKWNNGVKIGGLIIIGLLFWGTAHADVTFSIRYEDNLFIDAVTVALPVGDTVFSAVDSSTGDPVDVTISADTVLGVLSAIDDTDDGFSISIPLIYYSSFDSLFVECIEVDGVNACNNWLYVVNGVAPDVGMDKTTLADGDVIFVYFGPSRRVVLSRSTVIVGGSFEATAQDYQYEDNTWDSLAGVTIGVTQPDPDNPWSPIEIVLQAVDEEGVATFKISNAGSYNVGIRDEWGGYFPTVSLTIQAQGGGVAPSHNTLNVEKAIDFLSLYQQENGSMNDSALLSDWTALAFGAYEGVNFSREELKNYLLSDPSPGSRITDYERRAMALLALDINPYSGTDTNYIAKILDSFDGEQFGNPEFVNDDIFALFVLLRSGYTDTDPVIQSTVSSIVASQWQDGSWDSVDMTAAAVQALSLTPLNEGVSFALYQAKNYLKQAQEETGGFGNVYSTSWVLQALHVLEQDEIWWQKGNHTPGDYLYSMQAEDGGMNELDTLSNRIWATAYAVPASMEKTWGDILFSFGKPVNTEEVLVLSEEIEEPSMSFDEKQVILLGIKSELDVISQKVAVLEQEVQLLLDAYSPRYLAEVEEVVIAQEPKEEEEILLAGVTILPESDIFTASAVQSTRGLLLSQIFIWGIRIVLVAFFLYLVFLLGRAVAARRSLLQQ